ncbi:MAG: hypothetical protein J2P37_10900 [Ktedonobacteraceae bacterium]|nr:hypothetical protein [Ktedonobacteraceae bacterium]
MLDSHTILDRVRQGDAPEIWSIYRPKDLTWILALLSCILGIFFFCYLIWFLPIFLDDSILFNPFLFYAHHPWALLSVLLGALALSCSPWLARKRMVDATLILLPEGIVQCERWSSKSKRSTTVIEYAKTEKIALNVLGGDITFHPGHNNQDPESMLQVKSGNAALEIGYRNGAYERWTIPGKYADHLDAIIQRILTDYTRYTRSSHTTTHKIS